MPFSVRTLFENEIGKPVQKIWGKIWGEQAIQHKRKNFVKKSLITILYQKTECKAQANTKLEDRTIRLTGNYKDQTRWSISLVALGMRTIVEESFFVAFWNPPILVRYPCPPYWQPGPVHRSLWQYMSNWAFFLLLVEIFFSAEFFSSSFCSNKKWPRGLCLRTKNKFHSHHHHIHIAWLSLQSIQSAVHV